MNTIGMANLNQEHGQLPKKCQNLQEHECEIFSGPGTWCCLRHLPKFCSPLQCLSSSREGRKSCIGHSIDEIIKRERDLKKTK